MSKRQRSIIFSGPDVRAILEGRKTQFRRIIKFPMARNWRFIECSHSCENENDFIAGFADGRGNSVCVKSPYGKPPDPGWGTPGDQLWVRETWQYNSGTGPKIIYRADHEDAESVFKADHSGSWDIAVSRWRSPILMPRVISRITLEVTGVRVERLQEISEADAIAEGATMKPSCYGFRHALPGWSMDWSRVGEFSRYATGANLQQKSSLIESDISLGTPRMAFANFYNVIHDFDLWDANPWVWVDEFQRVHA